MLCSLMSISTNNSFREPNQCFLLIKRKYTFLLKFVVQPYVIYVCTFFGRIVTISVQKSQLPRIKIFSFQRTFLKELILARTNYCLQPLLLRLVNKRNASMRRNKIVCVAVYSETFYFLGTFFHCKLSLLSDYIFIAVIQL